jgi:GTP 3',8-cyclase
VLLLYDHFKRSINYLRISVTDRCNLRCRYCMPEEGVASIEHHKVLRLEEIAQVAAEAVALGIRKIRLTGGEPLVRRGIVDLVAMLSELKGAAGLEELTMTTNAVLLASFAEPLKAAGLDRVNISLDSLDPAAYREITRGGDVGSALEGIFAARDAGLLPVKLNSVIPPDGDRSQAEDVARFGEKHGFPVRFIRQMDLKEGVFSVVEGGEGGNCPQCNRLRLSSEGIIYPCLFSDTGYDTRTMGAREAIIAATEGKPVKGDASAHNTFYRLGG